MNLLLEVCTQLRVGKTGENHINSFSSIDEINDTILTNTIQVPSSAGIAFTQAADHKSLLSIDQVD